MEQQERVDQKRDNQKKARDALALQLSQLQDNRDEEGRRDKAIVDEANRLAREEQERLRQKKDDMKNKLQRMNEERDKHV